MRENLDDGRKIHRILEDVRENSPKPGRQKKNARKSRGQKEKCTEF